MKTGKLGPVGSFFLGLILIAIGGALTFFKGWPEFQKARESINWPSTTGIIERSEVIESGLKKKSYSAQIKYTFTVNNQKIISSQIYIGSDGLTSSSSSDAYKYTSKYPVGSEVSVYYSPTQVGEAVLEPGTSITNYILLGGGLLFLFFGLGMSLSSMKKITF